MIGCLPSVFPSTNPRSTSSTMSSSAVPTTSSSAANVRFAIRSSNPHGDRRARRRGQTGRRSPQDRGVTPFVFNEADHQVRGLDLPRRGTCC